MKTISVIIPIYNVSAYVERCIQSVMSQTYDDFECILVDDASPDDIVIIIIEDCLQRGTLGQRLP